MAVMPRGFFDFYGAPLGLVRLPIRDLLPVLPVYAMWRADAPLTLPAQRLLEAFVEEARGMPRAGPN